MQDYERNSKYWLCCCQNIFSNTLKLNLSKKEKNSENYNADFTKKRGNTGAKLGKLCKIPRAEQRGSSDKLGELIYSLIFVDRKRYPRALGNKNHIEDISHPFTLLKWHTNWSREKKHSGCTPPRRENNLLAAEKTAWAQTHLVVPVLTCDSLLHLVRRHADWRVCNALHMILRWKQKTNLNKK